MILYAQQYKSDCRDVYEILIRTLLQHGVKPMLCEVLYYAFIENGLATADEVEMLSDSERQPNARAILSIGGDGTFLEAAKRVMLTDVPVLGINKGRLGFLSDLQPEQIGKAIPQILNGAYRCVNLDVLSVYVNNEADPLDYALNEFSVQKCDNSSMISVHAYVDGDFLTTYWADGLIIATPTGSTAYSLSVGGPIAYPTTQSFILTPIAPHNLSMRSLILPNQAAITLHVESRSPKVLTSIDGRTHLLEGGCKLRIGKSPFAVKRILLEGHSFFATLRDKLMWGADRRN